MKRAIEKVSKKVSLKDFSQEDSDLRYWLSKTPQERLRAVTFLIEQNLKPGQKMDRSYHNIIKMK
jgi:hypothetical protein